MHLNIYKIFVATLVFATLIFGINAKTMTRCELAKELIRQGFPEDKLQDWVCLVEKESSRNTSAIGVPNRDKSHDYGLFQINDKYWCAHGKDGGECDMKCEDLIDDDITDDSKCVLKKIYRIHGFYAWNAWKLKCNNHTLPDVKQCFNDQSVTRRRHCFFKS